MGLLGGDSKSESNAIDNRMVNDGGSIQLQRARGATVSVTTVADRVVADALAANTAVAQASLDATTDAMRNTLAASAAAAESAIAAAQASAAQATESARDAMTNVSLISDKSQGYAWENAAEALGMTSNVIDMAFTNSSDLNKLSIDTVSNVADAYQSARETEVTAQFQDYRYIMIAGLAVVAVVALKALKK